MTKTSIYFLLSIFTLASFTACTQKTQDVKKRDITSTNSKQAHWQQSQSEKAMKDLDKELKK